MTKPVPLAEFPKHKKTYSAIDRLPTEVREQLIEARVKRTHTVLEMVDWLHDAAFEENYKHISEPMLNNWFVRRGYRANS